MYSQYHCQPLSLFRHHNRDRACSHARVHNRVPCRRPRLVRLLRIRSILQRL